MQKSKVIAIDGPSGSGKSTIAKIVAKRLSLTYQDTGAMFRAIAFELDDKNIMPDEDDKIKTHLEGIDFKYDKDSHTLVEINNINLTEKIREHHVSQLASSYSKNNIVRNYLKDLQRKIAHAKPSILEGRDIGTVIFPNAQFKFFLTASDEVRAQRRLAQLQDKDPHSNYNISDILQDIKNRDDEDSNREVAPLKKASDAMEIDTSAYSVEDVVEIICHKFESLGGFNQ